MHENHPPDGPQRIRATASAAGQARFAQYAATKDQLADALENYLTAALHIGGDDRASSLELVRVMLAHDINAAIDKRLLSVALTPTWAAMTRRDAQTERLAGGA